MFKSGFEKLAGRIGFAINKTIKDPAIRQSVRSEMAKKLLQYRSMRPSKKLNITTNVIPFKSQKHVESLQLRAAEKLKGMGHSDSAALDKAMDMHIDDLRDFLGMKETSQKIKAVNPWTGTGGVLGKIKTASEEIKGGLGDNKPDSSFDKKSLKKGMKVEKEHTGNKKITKEIAKDHLTEDKKYYDKLEKIEKKAEGESAAKRLLGHLHRYRREYITGTGAGAGVAGAIAAHKSAKTPPLILVVKQKEQQ